MKFLPPPACSRGASALLVSALLLAAAAGPVRAELTPFPDGQVDELLRIESLDQDGQTVLRATQAHDSRASGGQYAIVDVAASNPETREVLRHVAEGGDVHYEGPGLAYMLGTVTDGKLAVEEIGDEEMREFRAALRGGEMQLEYCRWVVERNPSDLAVHLVRRSLVAIAQVATSIRSLAPLSDHRDLATELAQKANHLHQQLEDAGKPIP